MTADLAVIDTAAIERLDPAQREAAVTAYLTDARDRLNLALDATGPAGVAAIKAEIATAAEATKQLGLSKEIQTDAVEMVRRAEFALGKAIRAGQEQGTIRRPYDNLRHGQGAIANGSLDMPTSPEAFATNAELSANGAGIYQMTDGVSEPVFDAAIADAKAEGNLSRANVVRKIKGVKSEGLTPVEKLATVRELAPTGRTSEQISKEIGCTEDYVRRIARDNGIEITADKVMDRTRRGIDSNRIVEQTVMDLSSMLMPLRLVKFDDLDVEKANDWAISLNDSLRALNRFAKQIKEMTQ